MCIKIDDINNIIYTIQLNQKYENKIFMNLIRNILELHLAERKKLISLFNFLFQFTNRNGNAS